MINSNDTYVDLFSALLLTEIERKRDRVWSFWVVPLPRMSCIGGSMRRIGTRPPCRRNYDLV